MNENIAIMLDSGIDIVVLLQGGGEVNLFQGGELDKPLVSRRLETKDSSLVNG